MEAQFAKAKPAQITQLLFGTPKILAGYDANCKFWHYLTKLEQAHFYQFHDILEERAVKAGL